MGSKILIAPSILSADFSKLAEDIKIIEDAGADWLHIDVMDGCFVPNLTIGPVVVKSIRPYSKLFFDVHLMIDRPDRYWRDFMNVGANIITFHSEVKVNIKNLINEIKSAGIPVGLSIKPGTQVSKIKSLLPLLDLVLVMSVEPGFGGQKFKPDVLPKIKEISKLINNNKLSCYLQVDGGIDGENGLKAVKAGANVLVAGQSIFGNKNPADALRNLRFKIDNFLKKK